jgi:mRNA-degrading endonuclease RelE of RelBE toxin-antitoxin system
VRLQYTERFRRAFASLSERDAIRVEKALRLLASDPRYPGLRVKRIQGTGGIWEARASDSIRITFEMEGDVLVLRMVGPHDATLNDP